MSRCLRFPPPGYVWNGVSGEALLELLKAQRERVKAERKKEKRRKIEKKKESVQGENWKKKQGHHRRHKRLRSNEGEGRSENQGKSEHETQEMEASSLTEELEQLIPDSLYESSDNSQSIRRNRNCISCNECHNHGSLVQIDFQQQKHKTPEALSSKPDCSTRMMDSVVGEKLELPVKQFSSAPGMPATDVQECVAPPLKELCHFSQIARHNMDKKSEMTQTESQFRELVVNWIPPLQIEHFDVDDQDWFFKRKPPRSDILETSIDSKDVLHNGNPMSCPCDQFLLHSSATMDSEVQKKLELDPTPVQEQISSVCTVPATDAQELSTPPLKVLRHSSSWGAGIDTDGKSEIAPTFSCSEISLLRIESQFGELVVNRLPPSLQFEPFDIGDQEWLFNKKQPRSNIRDTSTASYDVLHQGNFTQYPHAQYLPQANIYAFPYTILY